MTTKFQVCIPSRHADVLRRAAALSYPRECCGLLVGEGETSITVTDVVPTENIAENPAQAFEIDPQAHFDLLRRVRGSARRVIGHFHSHPHGPAHPSPRDLAMAHDPEAVWVLVTPTATPRAFLRPEGTAHFVEVPVTISEIEVNAP